MTTFDPDIQRQDPSIPRRIIFDLDGCMALDSSIAPPGKLRVGDTAEPLDYY